MVNLIRHGGVHRPFLKTTNKGSTLADELMVTLNDGLYADTKANIKFNIDYIYVEDQLNIEIIDLVGAGDRYYGHAAEVLLLSDEDLLTDK